MMPRLGLRELDLVVALQPALLDVHAHAQAVVLAAEGPGGRVGTFHHAIV
jgi:hypothetical protein